MKKIISFIMAVLMLCALCVTASAEGLTTLSGELHESKTYDNVVIKGDSTVKSGTNIVINGSFDIESYSSLTIESGASVTAYAEMGVAGNLIIKPGGTVASFDVSIWGESATIEIGGTLTGKWSSDLAFFRPGHVTFLGDGKIEIEFLNEEIANSFARSFGGCKTTVAEINDGDYKYRATVESHTHDFSSGVCSCGKPCPHNKGFTDGKCNICQQECQHEYWTNGVCTVCEYECKHDTWEKGVCTVCGVKGCVIGKLDHNWEKGVCTVCEVKGCVIGKLDHNWENGVCTVCEVKGCVIGKLDHNWENGVCTVCEYECPHENWTNGVCDDCGHVCTHEGEFCGTCGKELTTVSEPTPTDTELTASVFSEGNMTVVVGVACLAVGVLGTLLVTKKKKTSNS